MTESLIKTQKHVYPGRDAFNKKKDHISGIDGGNDHDFDNFHHVEVVILIERIHRRYSDLLRLDLSRIGIDDISPGQVMMLFTIGSGELSVRDLLDRGHYLGSNASYNLKQLAEAGYIEREVSSRDRRSARIRLNAKGQALCEDVRRLHETYHREMARNAEEMRDLEVTYRTLRRMEDLWTATLRYGELSPVDGATAAGQFRK